MAGDRLMRLEWREAFVAGVGLRASGRFIHSGRGICRRTERANAWTPLRPLQRVGAGRPWLAPARTVRRQHACVWACTRISDAGDAFDEDGAQLRLDAGLCARDARLGTAVAAAFSVHCAGVVASGGGDGVLRVSPAGVVATRVGTAAGRAAAAAAYCAGGAAHRIARRSTGQAQCQGGVGGAAGDRLGPGTGHHRLRLHRRGGGVVGGVAVPGVGTTEKWGGVPAAAVVAAAGSAAWRTVGATARHQGQDRPHHHHAAGRVSAVGLRCGAVRAADVLPHHSRSAADSADAACLQGAARSSHVGIYGRENPGHATAAVLPAAWQVDARPCALQLVLVGDRSVFCEWPAVQHCGLCEPVPGAASDSERGERGEQAHSPGEPGCGGHGGRFHRSVHHCTVFRGDSVPRLLVAGAVVFHAAVVGHPGQQRAVRGASPEFGRDAAAVGARLGVGVYLRLQRQSFRVRFHAWIVELASFPQFAAGDGVGSRMGTRMMRSAHST
eukprot:ctg_365.g108